jgi:outer membrane lipoprotein-sorting protein
MSRPTRPIATANLITRLGQIAFLLAVAPFITWPSAHAASPTTTPLSDPTTQADPQIDKLLIALDHRGKTLKSFTADATRSVIDPNLGTASTYRGTVVFQSLPNNDARLHAMFNTREDAGKIFPDKLEWVLADGQLLERNYHSKTEVTRQVARPGEKVNLFKLGEGSFPLPIGQAPQDVRANFTLRRLAADPIADPANTDHLQLTPRPGTSLARHFKTIDVWIDRSNDMPVRIETLDVNETEDLKTELTNLKINIPPRDADFQPVKIDKRDWQVTEE